ncbi:alcohol dehydrogenase zinc-binding domain-containing protein [Weissella koreensis KACC 15510]|uniref:quinone oxidoreductase family protein n=1 Tax=Weissella koreensis TaxID=165096 RepID=UPI0002175BE3|nr:zinc-binding alcohol dehydrogenase family protein [Weissella koreensis]AEJ23618.1 alcohol dehydrogenase zinc-binding domain-containing protein [Weissella koreensis KACC 15510]
MKAAIINEVGQIPTYGDYAEPVAKAGQVLINVNASALSNLTKMRAMGQHYSVDNQSNFIPGVDGVGNTLDGRRVYFAMTEAPYGGLANQTVVDERMIVPIPDEVDDIMAAAIANPGMSSWAALVYRAGLKPGQTVLINGATGSAGSLAIKIARYLGAGKVIVTGRDDKKLSELEADEFVSFDSTKKADKEGMIKDLKPLASAGIDIVLDYLWGDSALAIMIAVAKSDYKQPTKFITIGSAAGKKEVALPSALFRSSKLELIGSGINSVSVLNLLESIAGVYHMVAQEGLKIPTTVFSLPEIQEAWVAPTAPRAVVKVR